MSFVSPLWEYRLYYYGRRAWKNRVELTAQVGLDAVVVAVVVGGALTGSLGAVAVLRIFPDLLAVGFLGFALRRPLTAPAAG